MIYEELSIEGYQKLQETYGIGVLAAKVLASKHFDDAKIKEILYDDKKTSEFDLSGVEAIVKRIHEAKTNNEKIMICGDYDCDGVCATTILYDALTRFGCTCGYYIPDRFNEGYGVSLKTVKAAIEKDYKVLITVDNGVKATAELQYAREHGLSVILSDHHAYEEKDLVYDYFLHPNILDEFYGKLCGASLSFLISKALIGDDPYHTVLACIATIGDMVGALDANRVIIKEGIQLLKTMDFPAITLLSDTQNYWDATKVAFQIVPKINALGRLADEANVNTFVRYLLIRDRSSLEKVAKQINRLNDKRKKISAANEKEALTMVDENQAFIVVNSPSFHEGLNGIVAAKISKKYQRPAMVLSQKNNILKGSIRSIGIDVSTFFDDFKEKLLSFGGHRQAAGISLEDTALDELIEYTQKKCEIEFKLEHQQYISLLNKECTLSEVEGLSCLEPFGVDFEKPKFMIQDEELEATTMSNGLHLKFKSPYIEYVYFQHGHLLNKYAGRSLTFIGDLGVNVFRNKKTANMIVDDVIE